MSIKNPTLRLATLTASLPLLLGAVGVPAALAAPAPDPVPGAAVGAPLTPFDVPAAGCTGSPDHKASSTAVTDPAPGTGPRDNGHEIRLVC
ncbi:hypothetical protein ACN20G_31660 (plasmid) [Streptomyces sp. BI20]|uniref:hypothetical protein n=1 Tax=Streptomyces sp. BI20 TaxID=3403460 RepID=UPI003C72024A